ncbi:MAG TPA: CBASS cGAMP-activated phospholipase [Bryobacteraceae bacterium]|nr:CBASS cGAMP-activated phospholipase [Bryobacteraceae bacterium]
MTPGCLEKNHVRILSIDGGGIRGIVPAEVLATIEQKTGRPASALFDLIAGTSTGGILALALSQPDPHGAGPAHSAARMVAFYEELGPVIFDKSWVQFLRSMNGLVHSKYSDEPIETALENFFGNVRLSEAITSVFVPSYELTQRTPFFFRSTKARQDPAYDFPMRTVARSTSAAPTYFPPEAIAIAGTNDKYLLLDGGVFANNPAACALVEARVQFPQATEFTLVSLGTGTLKEAPLMGTPENWGLAQWSRPILDTVLNGVSSTVDYQMSQLLGKRADGTCGYFRIQAELTSNRQTLDSASPAAIKELRAITAAALEKQSRNIDELCGQIAA